MSKHKGIRVGMRVRVWPKAAAALLYQQVTPRFCFQYRLPEFLQSSAKHCLKSRESPRLRGFLHWRAECKPELLLGYGFSSVNIPRAVVRQKYFGSQSLQFGMGNDPYYFHAA